MLYLIIIGILILLGLAATAAYYVIKLRKVQAQQAQQIENNRQAWQKHRDELVSDLRFIANAMVQKQCEITEGCMRLAVLMDRLDDELQHKHQFSTIRAHFSQTAHMPTHEAYKALTRKEKFKLDNQRYALEEQNREQVLNEAKVLLEYRFDILTPN
ncbi:hypothetical protein NBRC116188_00120 [Oceaniserpentilla sp. 4NH20-0058]|uniref:DUF2489 domain-containing protein n=1 Tax=Oceaniserpentilla sp. 4NH20-0058 TaxID=3127660 RepID=UPI0031097FBA